MLLSSAARSLPPLIGRSLLPCAVQGSQALLSFSSRAAQQQQQPQQQQSWASSSKALWAAGALAASAYATTSGSHTALADAQQAISPPADPYALPPATGRVPSSVTVYQYEVCPFCCKVKAFLDYNKLPYTTVEVNPITKGELGWSSYRKVPVVKLDDEVVVDSSAIVSRLQAELQAASSGKGWFGKGGSKQAAARGGGSSGSGSADEVRWRKWVDDRFVKVLTANIYRTWDEAWSTTSYMAEQSSWNWGVRQGVRVAGALLMWGIGSRMPKKYNIEGDLRENLYQDANTFVAALGSKPFLGGASPNLADLAMYGVIAAIKGTDTYNDLVVNSRIGPWLSDMALAVGDSARVEQK